MKKGLIAALLLVMIAGLMAGCMGGGIVAEVTASPLPSGVKPSPTPTMNPKVQPEQLISAQEAAQLLGVEKIPEQSAGATTPPNSIAKEGMFLAFYNAGDGRFLQITVHQRAEELSTISVPKDLFDRLQRNVKDLVAVEGVGDSAFIAAPGLHMMANGYYVVIAVGDPTAAKNVEILKNAGKLVAEKLAAK